MTALHRLPRQIPLDISPDMPPLFIANGQTFIPWIEGVEVNREALKVDYNVTPRQTARGRTWASGSGKPKAVTMTLNLVLEAPNLLSVNRLTQRWTSILRACTSYSEGARSVYPIGLLGRVEPFGEGLTRKLSVTYLLYDDKWRLSPDDVTPKDQPIEVAPGLYPLGLLDVTGMGAGYYEVQTLSGLPMTDGGSVKLSLAEGQEYTLKTALIEVPQL
ncbi:hypothetical protein [Deinococcus xinjiangensis]